MTQIEKHNKVFNFEVSWPEKAILFGWLSATQFKNVFWVVAIAVRWTWPPVRVTRSFLVDN